MRLANLFLAAVALTAVSCTPTTTTTPLPPMSAQADRPTTFPSADAELAYLRDENARLRGQVSGVVKENAVMRDRTAVVEARQQAVVSGRLEKGMTVQEASRVINGSAELSRDTCQLINQTDTEWTYRILSAAPVSGPGSGATGSIGTNMRSGLAPTVQAWVCTFDAGTAKLTTFRREKRGDTQDR